MVHIILRLLSSWEAGTRRVYVGVFVVMSSTQRKLVHCPCHKSSNVVSIKSYMQCNDATYIRNYAHSEWGVLSSYSVHTQELRFHFFGRKVLAIVGFGAPSDSDVIFWFDGVEASGHIPAWSPLSSCIIWFPHDRKKYQIMMSCRLYQTRGKT